MWFMWDEEKGQYCESEAPTHMRIVQNPRIIQNVLENKIFDKEAFVSLFKDTFEVLRYQ